MQKPIKVWKALLRCALIVLTLMQGFSFSQAVAQTPAAGEDFSIYLAQSTFDPLQSLPEVPRSLAYSAAEAAANGVYIVQFEGPIEDAWLERLVTAGGHVGPYLPNYAFVVKLDAASLSRVSGMPEVRWVGPYQAAYKLAANVTPDDTRTYRVLVAPWADANQTTRVMSSFAAGPVKNHTLAVNEIQDSGIARGEQMITADLNGTGLEQAARVGDVLWIEPVYINELYNNIGGGTIIGGQTAWNAGYTGAGQVINVTDTGLDTGNALTVHQDFRGRVANIASWPVEYLNYGGGCYIANSGADDGAADWDGHGTHVSGSVMGNGAESGGAIRGPAYQATVNFQAIEQWTVFSSACSGYTGYWLTGIPQNVTPLLQQAYNWGARVQNESWGGGPAGVYDLQASHFDSFIASHQDFAVFVAAGNAGIDKDKNGYVDTVSINSPGAAKNVITVGASENERIEFTSTYSNDSRFPAAPTGTDRYANSRQHMAAFSSRGPMNDQRIKPDLVAPGTFILSTKSSQTYDFGWYPYNDDYTYMGGTSMASPLAAGAGTLVRQYYATREGWANPSAALVKATLINTAVDITGYGNTAQEAGQPIPNVHEGWGLINVGAATTPGRKFVDHATGLGTGATHTYQYTIAAGKPFKVSLVWSDAPGMSSSGFALVNNLNLKVTAPDGTTTYLGNKFSGGWSTTGGTADSINNVENVYIQSPVAGTWKVEVFGANVPQGPQRYALVVDGGFPPEAFNKTYPGSSATIPTQRTSIGWNASAFATSYEYCYDTTNNTTCDGVWTSTGTKTWTVLQGLADGTTYYWHVRAKNAYGTTYANNNAWWNFRVHVIPLPFDNYLPVLRK